MSTVTFKNVSKSFGKDEIIKPFSDVFEDGEFITLLGPSGCGKTTLLRMIAGFEHPTTGEIWIDDQKVSGGDCFVPPEKRNIGMVFQSYAVWPHMTVFENVAYPLQIKKVPREEITTRVNRMLEVVHLSQYAKRLPNQLSGGQQQRVALARALLIEPRLLLLDEPLSNLDYKLRESMRFEIKEITRSLGISVVYVTHDQTEAMVLSDRILMFNSGIVQQRGTPTEIYDHPASPFVADFLGNVDFFAGEIRAGRLLVTDWQAELPAPPDAPEGPVQVAIRPENIRLTPGQGPLCGTISQIYYLGSSTEFRVRIRDSSLRIIHEGNALGRFHIGDTVSADILTFLVFPGEDVRDQLLIRT